MRYSLLASRTILNQTGLLFFCLLIPAQAAPASVLKMAIPAVLTQDRPHWHAAHQIEKDTDAYPRQIVMDQAGNAFALWSIVGEYPPSIMMLSHYKRDVGWDTSDYDLIGRGGSHSIAMDGAGNAVMIFSRLNDSTPYYDVDICTQRYVTGVGWSTPELLENQTGYPIPSHVVIDSAGNAIAVWEQSDDPGISYGTYSIWANRYQANTGWGTAELLENDNDAGHAKGPNLAVDAVGNVVAIWKQSDGTRYNIWSNRYVVGTGWGTAQLLETDNAGDADKPHIGVDAAGNAIAVWQQSDGTRYSIWTNRYVVGTGWDTAQLLENDNTGDAERPRVGVDGAGNALVVWRQSDGTRYSIWTNRYVVGTGWGTAQLLENDNAGDADSPQVAMNTAGNAFVVWSQSDGSQYSIWAKRYVIDTGWESANLLENNTFGHALSPSIAINSAGRAIAIWQQWWQAEESNDLAVHIWAARFE